MTRPMRVVYIAAEGDELLRMRLETHLAWLEQQGKMQGWHGQQILAGSVQEQGWEEAMKSASLIVLLISADFFASPRCQKQMEQVLQWQRGGEMRVIPILLRAVDGKEAPFAHLKMLPGNGVPITSWPNPEEAFAEVVVGIRQVIEESSSPAAPVSGRGWPPVWMVPYARNPFFTGREKVLEDLHDRMAQSVPLHRLAQLMGHDSPNTTMFYAQGTKNDLQQAVETIAWT